MYSMPAHAGTAAPSRKRLRSVIVAFATSLAKFQKQLPGLVSRIQADGMIWIAWPKKASGVATDLTENEIRNIGLQAGLVDVKVCAVNEIWSGLKFVIRVKDRRPK